MNSVYFCIAVLAIYDKDHRVDSSAKIISEAEECFIVSSLDKASALAHIEDKYAFNKVYFEPIKFYIIEATDGVLSVFKNFIVKSYQDLQVGESYKLISEDTFIKGSEGWAGNQNWKVISVNGDKHGY